MQNLEIFELDSYLEVFVERVLHGVDGSLVLLQCHLERH